MTTRTETSFQETTSEEGVTCPSCGSNVDGDSLWQRYRVCSNCQHHARIGAWERLDMLVDRDSFEEIHQNLVTMDPLEFTDSKPYRERVLAAREKTGLNEAVLTGRATIRRQPCVVAIVDFGFLGGSMGSVAGEKIALAFEHAIDRKLPILTVVASGGARMQEGMLSLVQMAKTAAAAQRAHESNIPYISVVTDPTTGGMYASYVSQGDIILAEPAALIGFAGPRVIAATTSDTGEGEALKSHTAEFLFQHGFIDSIVDRQRLRDTLSILLQAFSRSRAKVAKVEMPAVAPGSSSTTDAWDTVQLARHSERPTALDYIHRISPHFIELHGDRVFGDDPAVVAGLGEVGGRGVVFIGLDRGHDDPARRGGQALPEGYRKAIRMMKLARRLHCPLVTFIDTPGAFLGIEAEERGLAASLSNCLAEMSVLPVPVVSVIIGEGGSGGALALGVADRILMQEHAIYSVIAPEGAAAILFRDPGRAAEVAESLKITARDCVQLGVADRLISEPDGGAHRDVDFAASMVNDAILWALGQLQDTGSQKLVEERYRKFRRMGQVNRYWRELVHHQADVFGSRVVRSVESLRDRFGGEEREIDAESVVESPDNG